ncbi:MAG: hypothetical protein LBB59_00820 [Campylobacteraceae bacterium]|jgi:hypothetical protein|nr:hypothetical protein [Campylobacteraceae bacterium]
MKDLTNIAYSNEYTKLKSKIINSAYNPSNKINEIEMAEGNLKRIITEYRTNSKKYYCSNNKIYNEENKLLFEYFNLYHHPFFCKKIAYNDEKERIFYKADLYGYNVFEINTNKTFDYFPKCSFGKNGIETFIATDIYFNPNNNVFAVVGCYWACPTDTFLVKINDPIKQFEKYINIHLIIDENYEKYDDIVFAKWERNDIKLKCYNIEIEPYKNEIITLNEKEYTRKMINI